MPTIDVRPDLSSANVGGVTFVADTPTGSGTGGYFTFLAVQDNSGTEEGFNHDGTGVLDTDAAKTQSLAINTLETRTIDGVNYYILRMDMNEPGNGGSADAPINLTEFKLYTSAAPATLANFSANQDGSGDGGLNLTKVYDLDAGGVDNTLLLRDRSSGSGTDDYEVRIPVSLLSGGNYLTLYTKFTDAQSGFEEVRALTVPFVAAPAIDVTKSVTSVTDGSDYGVSGQADSAGDVINYAITIHNTGNVALTGVTVMDAVEGGTATAATAVTAGGFNTGDANMDSQLSVGETWNYTAAYTLTQADLDGAAAGDGDIDNVATGDTVETAPDTAAASVTMVRAPSINVTKVVTSVTDGADYGGSGQADSAGDTINYAITIQNTGNVALTGVTVMDAVEGGTATAATAVTAGGFNTGDANMDGKLSVGETWNYTATYTLTQADLDGAAAGDGDIDNVATGDTAETGPDTADASVTMMRAAAINVTKAVTSVTDGADFGASGQADSAGDVINYAITIQNTGNVALTGVTVMDAVEGGTATAATAVMAAGFNTGDANMDGKLSVGETWNYTAAYTLTQADLDGAAAGDGDIDNVATGDTAETGPDTAEASVTMMRAAAINVTKAVTSVTDGGDFGGSGRVDSAGDTISYAITVQNTGNVALTGVTVMDAVEGGTATAATAVMAAGFNTGDANMDGQLSVGETWNYTAAFTLTQADLDAAAAGDGDIDNLATGDTAQTGPDTAEAAAPVVLAAALDVQKEVSVDGGLTWSDADTPTGPNAAMDADIQFRFMVTNTGNVTLSDVMVTDDAFDLNGAASGGAWAVGTLAVGASSATFVFGDDASETVTWQAGQHADTATATGMFDGAPVTDTDMAHYFGMGGEGLSHGYWKNHAADWDLSSSETNSFETFFGVNLAAWSLGKKAGAVADVSFDQALSLQGGGVYALAREAVAAVLNANDEDIGYLYSEGQIITLVQTAFSTGNYETAKNLLEAQNTAGDWLV